MTQRLLALAFLACAACSSSSGTTVVIDVTADSKLMLDQLAVKANGVSTNIEMRSEVTLLLDDAVAGKPLAIEIDGLHSGTKLAHGEGQVTPVAGREVRVTIDLSAAAVCQADAADQCVTVPEPTCISSTTLRTSTGPGVCVDNACKYEFVDIECPRGCADNKCICDSVTKAKPAAIDVTTVIADRTFKVNGALVPDSSVNGFGSLFLRNAFTGDEISWGSTTQASAPVAVVAGTYDVFYEVQVSGSGIGGATVVPLNKRARIATAVDLRTSQTMNLDITAVKADRTFTVNGAAMPDSSANGFGNLFLRNVVTGDEVTWGSTTTASSPRQIIAGTYDVFYEVSSFGTGAGGVATVPRNKRAKIAAAASITTTAPLALAVTEVKVDRTFTLNGTPVPDSFANGSGNLFLRNGATGDEVSWGITTSASTVPIIAGTYDVFYQVSQFGNGSGGVITVPRNKNAKIAAGLNLIDSATTTLDVAVVKVDRTFTVNGAQLTDSTVNGFGNLFIRNVTTGDEVTWGSSLSTTSPVQIIAGTYDVFYELVQVGSGAGGAITTPRNKRARVVAAADLSTTTPLAIAVTAVKVDRNFTVNGDPLTDSTVNGFGSIFIRNVATGDEISWGSTTTLSSPQQIIAGTYDVFYEVQTFGSGVGGAPLVPRNDRARIATAVNLTGGAPLDLATTVVKVDRTFKVNGADVPDSSVNGFGTIFARVNAISDEISWSSTTQTTFKVPMLVGTYDINYELSQAGSGVGGATVVPRNKRALLSCIDVSP